MAKKFLYNLALSSLLFLILFFLTTIRGLGRKAGAALNPTTPIDTLKEVLVG